jgi:calcium/calmodulin-dependent protein kinase (CaM kinase) II
MNELIELTEQLLQCIAAGDWQTYERLCDPSLTAFEPEACGHLVEGMDFHHFYFERTGNSATACQTTMVQPHVRMLGPDVAVVCYNRIVQHVDAQGRPVSSCFEETRIWQLQEGDWQHVHFHRSTPNVPER